MPGPAATPAPKPAPKGKPCVPTATTDPSPQTDASPKREDQKYNEAMAKVLGMTVTAEVSELIKYSLGTKLIHVDQLKWDMTLKHGQCRKKRGERVKELKGTVAANPPRVPVSILVWDAGRMWGACWAGGRHQNGESPFSERRARRSAPGYVPYMLVFALQSGELAVLIFI